MTQEEKAKAYDEALEKAGEWIENPIVWSSKDICQKLFPSLVESEDERIRKRIRLCLDECVHSDIIRDYERVECLDYLEKRKESIEKEYVFRPLAGTDIAIAAEQAIRRAKKGDYLVLAFNGFYTPVNRHDSVKRIVDDYHSFIEYPNLA